MPWLGQLFGRRSAKAAGAATPAKSPARATTDDHRSVRVFISSTFLDMQQERDVLVRQTFPALRSRFRARGVELREVDLRWGITRAQAESGEIVPICLAEIDRCRPFFIGLLGERYGWIPPDDALPDRVRDSYPAIAAASGCSVTELEIIHGVLASSATAEAFFFERDAAWIWSLPAEEAAAAAAESRKARARQAELKKRIRASGARVTSYASPEVLGHAVEAVLAEALDARFPNIDAADPFVQDARLHQAYARERVGLHVGAERYVETLDRWLADAAAPPMLIVGASGGGKSTLIANWLHRLKSARSHLLIFDHYLGASPDSADPILLMRRLWEFLNRAEGESVELPTGTPNLMTVSEGLWRRLAQAGAFAKRNGTHILIALDGLDKLAQEQNLRWIPAAPPRVKMLVSSLEGAASDAARGRDWSALAVEPLTESERRAFVNRTLEAWGKRLSADRAERILAHALAGTPLFLRTVLDELRFSATEARLDWQLDLYLQAGDMDDLFGRVLERVETDAGRAFAAQALSLVWASRAGLEEIEILAITNASPLSWSLVRNGLADGLRDQGGRITFGHDFLRTAVAERYLPNDDARRAAHLTIADHYASRPIDLRQAEELPFQLRAAEGWDRLESLLLDVSRLGRQLHRGEAEYLSYWLPLMERGRDLETLLVEAFEARVGGVGNWPREALAYADAIRDFLEFAGMRGSAFQRLAENRASVARGVLGKDDLGALDAKGELAETYRLRGNLAQAKALYEEVLESYRRTLGDAHLETLTTMNNLAGVLFELGEVAAAQAHFERVIEARTMLLGPEDPETITSMNNLAQTLSVQGDIDGAIALQKRVTEASARVLGPDDYLTLASSVNLGKLHRRRGDFPTAQRLLVRALGEVERVLGPEHPLALSACADLGVTLGAMREYAGAKAFSERAFEGSRRALGMDRVETLRDLSNYAAALAHAGDLGAAAERYREAYEGRKRVLGPEHPDTLMDMADLALALYQLGDLVSAERLQAGLVEAATRVLGPDHSETRNAVSDLAKTRAAGSARGRRPAGTRGSAGPAGPPRTHARGDCGGPGGDPRSPGAGPGGGAADG